MTRKISAFLLLFASTAFASTKEQVNKTFPAAPGGTLTVDVDFGAIEVSADTTPGEIIVDAWRKVARKNKDEEQKYLRDNPIQFIPEGNNLTIRCKNKERTHWLSGWRNRNEGRYIIHVPAQFNANLDTAGGPIDVRDLAGTVKADTSGGGLHFARLQGSVRGDTSGGGVNVEDCRGAIKVDTSGGGIDVAGGGGSLDGNTSGGGVSVRNFDGPASVETSGGGMRIDNVKGKVHAETSGGPIEAELPSPIPGDVTLSTSGGGVTINVQASSVFNLDAETSGGGVTCDLPITVQGRMDSGRLKGVVNGGGPTITLRSTGGGIHIRKI